METGKIKGLPLGFNSDTTTVSLLFWKNWFVGGARVRSREKDRERRGNSHNVSSTIVVIQREVIFKISGYKSIHTLVG